jgi:cytochrome b involved in lipid metabolism
MRFPTLFYSYAFLLRTMATDARPTKLNREKVALKPGFHLVDWMRLTQVSTDMRTPGPLRKISLAELSTHKSQFDAWTAYKGKVYNITQYIAYHPGGEKTLMSGAGKDCTAQFNKFHAWVNGESMLSKCLIGVLMSEELPTTKEENEEKDDEIVTAKEETITRTSESRTILLGGAKRDLQYLNTTSPNPATLSEATTSVVKLDDVTRELTELEIDADKQ